ncbi:MAG TPA: hypothetical protein VLT13_09895 [Bacteroidota bacterium]|nr:hypothetical protein [Bacteroidota bacterium]
MFLGHYAVALVAKKASPQTSLGTLFLGAQFIDLLWPILLVAGVEHVRLDPGNTVVTPLDFYNYPFSHSLTGVVIWSVLVGGVYFAFRRYRRGALVLGAAVLSHWVLDLLTHRPDLPLTFSGEARAGFGLWNSLPFTLIVELGLFAAGVVFYLRATSAKDRVGRYALWALILVLAGIYLMNLFGPPPPNVEMIGIAGNAGWLFVLWAYWVDRHRSAGTNPRSSLPART